jgi:hypothetical protein
MVAYLRPIFSDVFLKAPPTIYIGFLIPGDCGIGWNLVARTLVFLAILFLGESVKASLSIAFMGYVF